MKADEGGQAPSIARVYDYLLGGKDNCPVDREIGDHFKVNLPGSVAVAHTNRGALIRAVRALGRGGIRQFVDLGSGLTTADNVHRVAQRHQPGAAVVYVGTDPTVLAHGRALLAEDDTTTIIEGDVRDPGTIRHHPETERLTRLRTAGRRHPQCRSAPSQRRRGPGRNRPLLGRADRARRLRLHLSLPLRPQRADRGRPGQAHRHLRPWPLAHGRRTACPLRHLDPPASGHRPRRPMAPGRPGGAPGTDRLGTTHRGGTRQEGVAAFLPLQARLRPAGGHSLDPAAIQEELYR